MARFSTNFESQAGLPAGAPTGLTFNGYAGALVAGATVNLRLRRLILGVIAGASVPTSQQISVGLFRQTVRVAGTGFVTTPGIALDPRSAASGATGVDVAVAAAAGTTGPSIDSTALARMAFNSQSAFDLPWEGAEELIVDRGTANGLAIVNLGNPLPPGHRLVVTAEWEE